jgi:quercetin dioxygenase-like cupin family protein
MENMKLEPTVLISRLTRERSVWYNGNLFTFLISGAETNGAFALLHNFIQKGTEPPTHTHTREAESFYLLEGEIEFWLGDKPFTAVKDDFVHLPENIPHRFRLKTDTAKVLLHISPAGFENFFKENSVSATGLELPPMPAPPTREEAMGLIKSAAAFGVIFQRP